MGLNDPGEDVASAICVLVVDDDPVVRALIQFDLEADGFVVETARNRDEAVDRGASTRLDLIILDLNVGMIDGESIAADLQRLAYGYLPVLVLSGDPHLETRAAHVPGAIARLRKPFDLEDLRSLVHSVTDLPRGA